jgi:sulfotransferase
MDGLHFISGLPRAGSTLLAAMLRQNPRIHAGITSPVGSMVSALLREMSQANESAVFIDDAQRTAVLRGVFSSYYGQRDGELVFDTNRLWCARLPLLAGLFPAARVVCCVRHMPWVLDSLERLIRANPLELSSIFNFDTGGTVYSRVEGLSGAAGMVGFAFNALREAVWSAQMDRLLLVRYESLTTNPQHVLDTVYDFIGAPRFTHDPAHVRFDDADEFDRRLGTPGLHQVRPIVQAPARQSVLPPDLFARFEGDSFWQNPGSRPAGLRII